MQSQLKITIIWVTASPRQSHRASLNSQTNKTINEQNQICIFSTYLHFDDIYLLSR